VTKAKTPEPKAEPKSEPKSETKVEATTNHVDLIKRVGELYGQVKTSVQELLDAREQLKSALDANSAQLKEMRSLLGTEEDEVPERTRPTQGARRGRKAGSKKKLIEYVFEAMKKAGAKGASQYAISEMVKKGGFDTDATSESFAKSVYVSGINALMKQGLAVNLGKVDGESRYALSKGAPATLPEV
jgi:phosphoenolpyruvate synthase/pyruvate phosphate dikinase